MTKFSFALFLRNSSAMELLLFRNYYVAEFIRRCQEGKGEPL